MENSIGLLEFYSIGRGIEITDRIVKTSNVKVKICRPICTGKFFTLIIGEVSDVEEAIKLAQLIKGDSKLKSILIPNLHSDIIRGLSHKYRNSSLDAIGIMELRSVVTAIKTLDKSLKTSDVIVKKLNLSSGIGSKSYFIIGGDVASVKEAMKEGSKLAEENQIVSNIMISAPSDDILESLNLIRKENNKCQT